MRKIDKNLNIYNPSDIKSGIYIIKSKVHPDRYYIGSAKILYNRLRRHLFELKKGNHHSSKLQRHFNKYGQNDFFTCILEQFEFTTHKYLLEREQYYLDRLKPFFNECLIAGNRGDAEVTEETRIKLSLSKKGELNPNFGKHPSSETIEKRVKKLKGRRPHQNNIDANIKRLTGVAKTKEVRNKISNTLKGRPNPNKGRKYGKYSDDRLRKKLIGLRIKELLKSIGLTEQEWRKLNL